MRIFFSVGEPSGDAHAAKLIRELRERAPGVECVGYGGPKMAAAGCELHADLTQLALMWIVAAIANLHRFWGLAVRADRYFARHKPDAAVLVDFPGFNWWIARRAKAHGIPVFYYSPPQVWAWFRFRVRKLRRLADHVLCGLPFEAVWLKRRGVNATFVGHPFFDGSEAHVGRITNPSYGRLVTLLPGSRTSEVETNLGTLLRVAEMVRGQVPDVRFAVACYKRQHAEMVRERVREWEGGSASIEVHHGRTPELMRQADCCVAVSGSVSLELLHYQKPTVIVYRLTRFWTALARRFLKIKYVTLVNLLSDPDWFPERFGPFDPATPPERAPFPEYVGWQDFCPQVASHLVGWLTDPAAKDRVVRRLIEVKRQVGQPGASARAADYILAEVRSRIAVAARAPRPHFVPPGEMTVGRRGHAA
jgi:lipid-A-disaccharide synthase